MDSIATEITANHADIPVMDMPIPEAPATTPVVAPDEDRFVGDLKMSPDNENVTIFPLLPPLPAVSVIVQDEGANLAVAFQRPLTKLHHMWHCVVVQCWKRVVGLVY